VAIEPVEIGRPRGADERCAAEREASREPDHGMLICLRHFFLAPEAARSDHSLIAGLTFAIGE
jgi:hypothetical protein